MTVRRRRSGGEDAAAQAALQAEADAAWRAHLKPVEPAQRMIAGTAAAAEYERQGEALEARYGAPSWNALLYASPEDQAQGERIIAARTRRAPAEVY